jgi:hypothetical protein
LAAYSKLLLSGSTDGRPIKVAATATPGTALHTAVAGSASFDELWLYAINTSASQVKLTVELGGTTDPDDLIEVGIAAESGLVQIVPGIPLNNGAIVRAFAATGNVINIVGFINRII